MSGDDLPGTTIFRGTVDLASGEVGGKALLASDEFFAGCENLVDPREPEWREGEFTERGKWMDGWEPRRRRAPGHDWAIVKLGLKGDLVGADIDTRWFTGNHAPFAALFATVADDDATPEWLRDSAEWTCVLPQVRLDRGGHNVVALEPFKGATHVMLHIYPAGGVARLRVHGRPTPVAVEGDAVVDLACVTSGGRTLACSDAYFAKMENLLLPQPPPTMGDGWETKRSPFPKQDWVAIALGAPGRLRELVLDTMHFKGNYPEAARVDAIYWPDAPPYELMKSPHWEPITGDVRLGPHAAHRVVVDKPGPWTHLKLTILTDGGIARLRAMGVPTKDTPGADDPLLQFLNEGDDDAVREAITRCCGARRFVDGLMNARPFGSRAHLMGAASEVFWHLGDGDWLEAFEHHPRIGADPEALKKKFQDTAGWAQGEQAGVKGASDETLAALAEGNRRYEERFGHIFIVCASGLSADEMLSRLVAREPNEPAFELRVAAGEQLKITKLRLEKLEVPS